MDTKTPWLVKEKAEFEVISADLNRVKEEVKACKVPL